MKAKVITVTAAQINTGNVIEVDATLPANTLFLLKKRFPAEMRIVNDCGTEIGVLPLTEKEVQERIDGLNEFPLLQVPRNYAVEDSNLLLKTAMILIQKQGAAPATEDLRIELFNYVK